MAWKLERLDFGFAIGGTLTHGLALAGMLDFASDGSDHGIFMGEYALALNYYFLPVNLYVAASIGRASGWYEDLSADLADERRVKKESSFAYTDSLGREFLFENSAWGLGPALRFWYCNFDNGSFIATALVLSATHH